MKAKLILLLLITFTNNSSTALDNPNGNTMSILHNQPLFFVKIDTFGTRYVLKINGVTLLRESSSEGQMTTMLPINHWMHPDKNTMEVQIRPPKKGEEFNPNARLEYSLILKSNTDPDAFHILSTINITGTSANSKETVPSSPSGTFNSFNQFKTDDKGDVNISNITIEDIKSFKGGLIYKRQINSPSSLPLWNFFDSDDVPNVEPMSDAEYYNELDILLNEYLKVQEALKTKDIDAIMPLFTERNKELDKAFYRTQGETESSIRESLNESASDTKLELVDLTRLSVNFAIEDNRKIARLLRPKWTPAIVLNLESGGSIRHDMYFRYKDGKWILTR